MTCVQVYNRFEVNNLDSTLAGPPDPANATHGDFFYNATLVENPWPHWNGGPYNDTTLSLFVAGQGSANLRVQSRTCPRAGCDLVPEAAADDRGDGVLLWSDEATWTGADPPLTKPVEVRACRFGTWGQCCDPHVGVRHPVVSSGGWDRC